MMTKLRGLLMQCWTKNCQLIESVAGSLVLGGLRSGWLCLVFHVGLLSHRGPGLGRGSQNVAGLASQQLHTVLLGLRATLHRFITKLNDPFINLVLVGLQQRAQPRLVHFLGALELRE